MEVRNSQFTQNYTKVFCEDDWKYNAPNHFVVKKSDNEEILGKVDFQVGPVKEVGVNGVANEDLLLMVVSRLEGFQKSEYRCIENQEAINSILDAVSSLRSRTQSRIDRGVEGTSTV